MNIQKDCEFCEVFDALKLGKSVKRKIWTKSLVLKDNKIFKGSYLYDLQNCDILANDWEIVEEVSR